MISGRSASAFCLEMLHLVNPTILTFCSDELSFGFAGLLVSACSRSVENLMKRRLHPKTTSRPAPTRLQHCPDCDSVWHSTSALREHVCSHDVFSPQNPVHRPLPVQNAASAAAASAQHSTPSRRIVLPARCIVEDDNAVASTEPCFMDTGGAHSPKCAC